MIYRILTHLATDYNPFCQQVVTATEYLMTDNALKSCIFYESLL